LQNSLAGVDINSTVAGIPAKWRLHRI